MFPQGPKDNNLISWSSLPATPNPPLPWGAKNFFFCYTTLSSPIQYNNNNNKQHWQNKNNSYSSPLGLFLDENILEMADRNFDNTFMLIWFHNSLTKLLPLEKKAALCCFSYNTCGMNPYYILIHSACQEVGILKKSSSSHSYLEERIRQILNY